MLLLIEFVIAQEAYKRDKTMIHKLKKLFQLLSDHGGISAPAYTCESALLMGC